MGHLSIFTPGRLPLLLVPLLIGAAFLLRPDAASAHCDTLDGPVATAARGAMETNNINRILIWVRPEDEAKIRKLFKRVMKRRAEGGEPAKEAEEKLLTELIRIHREGEGAEFTGLKPAGQVEPSIAALDASLTAGSPEHLTTHLGELLTHRLEEGVHELTELSRYDIDDVEAGRAYVERYVGFAHFVEGIEKALEMPTAHHTAHAEEHALPSHR